MKIAYLASSALPSRAANGIHVMKMGQALSKNGHAVTLFYPDKKADIQNVETDIFSYYGVAPIFNVRKLPWPALPGKGYIYALAAACASKKENMDLVFGRNLAGCFFAALMGLPVILESHAPVSDSGMIQKAMFERLIRHKNFKKLVVITHALKSYYVERYPFLESQITVAADGADPVSNAVAPVKLNGEGLSVGYVGHLYPGKGLEVISALAPECSWADFHIVGGLEEDIKRNREALSAVKNVTFHGSQPPSRVNDYLAAFDVVLLPNQHKVSAHGGSGEDSIGQWTSPLKAFEYMAAGKAIIASDLPVLHEVLAHGENALLAPPIDIQAWKSHLEYLRDRPDKRDELGCRAKDIFLKNYTWQARAEFIMRDVAL